MILKDLVNEKMKNIKIVTKSWDINKIIENLETDTIDNAINICLNRLEGKKHVIGTDLKERTTLYYHVKNGNILISLEQNDFDTNSLDRYFYDFENDEEKLRVMFCISGELSGEEKLNF